MYMTAPEMQEINAAMTVFHEEDRERGLAMLHQLWEKLSPGGTPMQLCGLAHILADQEAEPAQELEWDLRALEAATGSRDAGDLEAVSPAMTSLLPSLHLSVANGYRKVGDLERARQHVVIAADRVHVLADDGYGKLIRGGLKRLQLALGLS